MAHQTLFQSLKHSDPVKPQMRFNRSSKPRPLASQTMPDLRLFRQAEPEDRSKQYASCLPDIIDWDMAGPAPSPINTAPSPSFSGSPAATFPFTADGSSKHDKEIEELEYERSEADDQFGRCMPTATDDDQSMCEEDDDDDNSTVALGRTLREPSLNASLLFTPCSFDSELPTLFSENTVLISQWIKTSALAISRTVLHYRTQLNVWEQDQSASRAVFRASALINQCLLRIAHIFDPIWDRLVKRLVDFEKESLRLEQILSNPKLDLSNQAANPTAFSELCELGDQCSRIEGALSDLSSNLTDLYEWTDACLTPSLAELTPSTPEDVLKDFEMIPEKDRRSNRVSTILDAHSYLCVQLDKLSNNIKLIQISFEKLSNASQRFPRLVIHDYNSCLEGNGLEKYRVWLKTSRVALIPIKNALAVLASYSASTTTFGRPSV